MASYGSPAPSAAGRSSSRSMSSRKASSRHQQIPLKEYFIPASPSVQQLKRQEAADAPRAPSYAYTSNVARIPASSRSNVESTNWTGAQAEHVPKTQYRSRTTSVAKRVLLRPKADESVPASSSRVTGPQSPAYQPEIPPKETNALPRHRFRYERNDPPRDHAQSDQRFEAFASAMQTTQGNASNTVPSNESRHKQSLTLQARRKLESVEVDDDFILQFARDHQLELGTELAQTLFSNNEPGDTAMLPTTLQKEALLPAPTSATTSVVAPTSLFGEKPPRPPKSSRRLSANPSPVSPTPFVAPLDPTPCATIQSSNQASAFDDAFEAEEEQAIPVHDLPSLAKRRASVSSTRPSRSRRERCLSNASTAAPVTPASTRTMKSSIGSTAQRQATPKLSPAVSTKAIERPPSVSPSAARELIMQFDDHAIEDVQRNFRLATLLRDVGAMPSALDDSAKPGRSQTVGKLPVTDGYVDYTGPAENEEGIVLTSGTYATALEEQEDIWTGNNYVSESSRDDYSQDSSARHSEESSNESWRTGNEDVSYKKELHDQSAHHSSAEDEGEALLDAVNLPADGDGSSALRESHIFTDLTVAQRASLGITDSVLASILAADSFCLPDGVRLSMDQIRARLSSDLHRRTSGRANVPKTNTAGQTDRVSSCHRQPVPVARVPTHSAATKEGNIQYRSDGSVEHNLAQKRHDRAAVAQMSRMCRDPLMGLAAQEEEAIARSSDDNVQKRNFRQSTLSLAEAIALRPLPLDLPDEPPLTGKDEVSTSRRRSRTFSAFQRLGLAFGGSSASTKLNEPMPKAKGRKRLTSFFSGAENDDKHRLEAQTKSGMPTATSPKAPNGAASSRPGILKHRKRALTGPTLLPAVSTMPTQHVVRQATHTKQMEESLGHLPVAADTWRSTVPPDLYAEMLEIYPSSELHRQEIIYELFRTEESFVMGLQGVVRVFSQPLRNPQGSWISGVPPKISRLLDWLDDIVYVHLQIYMVMHSLRQTQGLVVCGLANALQALVPLLEVHLPYLVRFESVTQDITSTLSEPDSDFGEFVRMQQALPECGSMSLASFLLKPVQRLMKYPLFFKQLRDLTPEEHPEGEAAAELLVSLDSIIRVMEEVKAREEEYRLLQAFAARLHGMPTGLSLAQRDRRLLACGLVGILEVGYDACESALQDRAAAHVPRDCMTSSVSMVPTGHMMSNRKHPDFGKGSMPALGLSPRPVSYFSDAGSLAPSLLTDYSGSSTALEGNAFFSPILGSQNSQNASPAWHSRSGSPSTFHDLDRHLASPGQYAGSTTSPTPYGGPDEAKKSQTKGTLSSSSTVASGLRGILKSSSSILSASSMKAHKKVKGTPLFLFVFSDLVLFASKDGNGVGHTPSLHLRPSKSSLRSQAPHNIHSRSAATQDTFTLEDDWGLAKIVGLYEVPAAGSEVECIQLDLLPIWSDSDANKPFTVRTAALSTRVIISLRDDMPSASILDLPKPRPMASIKGHRAANAKEAMTQALRSVYLSTVQSVSLPGVNDVGGDLSRVCRAKKQRAEHKQTAQAFTNNAIPRSPSGRLFQHEAQTSGDQRKGDLSMHRLENATEREERAFWSLRLRQVKEDLHGPAGAIDAILSSGLMSLDAKQIEQIHAHAGAEVFSDVLKDTLVDFKRTEGVLTNLIASSRRSIVKMQAGAQSGSIGLAISYDGSDGYESDEFDCSAEGQSLELDDDDAASAYDSEEEEERATFPSGRMREPQEQEGRPLHQGANVNQLEYAGYGRYEHRSAAGPPVPQPKSHDMSASPSLETVYTVQRAHRVPIAVRRM